MDALFMAVRHSGADIAGKLVRHRRGEYQLSGMFFSANDTEFFGLFCRAWRRPNQAAAFFGIHPDKMQHIVHFLFISCQEILFNGVLTVRRFG
jgi:hypothetical protein